MNRITLAGLVALLLFAAGCGGGNSATPPPPPPTATISVAVSSGSIKVFQGESSGSVNVTLIRTGTTGSVTLTLTGVPSGGTTQVQQPGATNSGSVTIDPGTAAAGSYPITISASDGAVSGSANMTLTVGAVAQIANHATGQFALAMSTGFQPIEWDYQFFVNHPGATTPLGNLRSEHIRLQPISLATPQKWDQSWDFSTLDAILDPVISVGDHSPELQLAWAPIWMDDSSYHLLPAHYADFATYAANMVRYYNTTTGFQGLPGTTTYVHSASTLTPVTYWGIHNEPNINGLTAAQYVQLYNQTVPAMQAVDPNLKFVAVELADFLNEEQTYLPAFVSGVTAQVDVVATHFYSTCNHNDTDQQLFSTIPRFATGVKYIYSQLATNPALVNVPVWVTENNVNSDYNNNGMSACNPGQAFVADARGSSAFFAAWRPYVFSQLGKAGAHALYHWDFASDAQFGELDESTGNPRLSYWVDYWLARKFPSPPGQDLLGFSSTDTSDIELLATRNTSDNSVVVMIVDRAVAAAADNNGQGAPRTVAVDVSALGTYTSGSLMVVDANTNVTTAPVATSVTPTGRIEITLNGYGVAFLTLAP
jgi:hypothetical protein